MIHTYKGYDYIAFEWKMEVMFLHNGYVKIPKDNPLYDVINQTKTYDIGEKGHKHEHKSYDTIPSDISAHGGFTFAEQVTQKDIERKRWKQPFTPGLWIGWDYAHLGDCFFDHDNKDVQRLSLGNHAIGGRKHWTLPEIEEECKAVIDSLIAYKKKTIEQLTFTQRLERYRDDFREELMSYRRGHRSIETLLDEIIASISVEAKKEG